MSRKAEVDEDGDRKPKRSAKCRCGKETRRWILWYDGRAARAGYRSAMIAAGEDSNGNW